MGLLSGRQQLAQHELQDASVPVVLLLLGSVDSHRDRELLVIGGHGQLARDVAVTGDPGDVELLVPGEAERLRRSHRP